MSSDLRIATIKSTSSASDSALMVFLTSSLESENFLSFSQRIGSPIFAANESIDFWKLLIPSLRVIEKIRCISDLAPKGCAKKISRRPDMTAAGLAIRITFFMTEYGIKEWIFLAWANSSGELSSARKR